MRYLVLQYLGGLIGIYANYLTLKKIQKGSPFDQNLVTWILWGILDTIVSITTILENGNWALPLAYAIGAFVVSFFLIKRKEFHVGLFEVVIMLAIFVCLIIWEKTGNIGAIIACTSAVCLSGIPQIKDTWNSPSKTPTIVYVYFGLAEILSFSGGKSWSIEEKFYSGAQFIVCIFVILFSLRKKNQLNATEKIFFYKKGLTTFFYFKFYKFFSPSIKSSRPPFNTSSICEVSTPVLWSFIIL